MIPPLDAETGYLPQGRYACTESEIQERFVDHEDFAASKSRREVWEHYAASRDFILQRVPLYRVWFAGSFMTAKIDPEDLDVTWVWDADAFEGLDDQEKIVLQQFAMGKGGLARFGLRIDSYAVPWRCIPAPTTDLVSLDPYFRFRGYWDDWWLRARTGPKDAPPKQEDAYPRRGYLEVTIREHA
ncbi:DUF6932 family protein [Micromonospora aurantiaca (nom. illeg.)]|uniref:DUF6932 family protein n=1 Tax=Micromonospora aurantiaca (nom. illeg.) TaxID=47850 RepID=UPI003EBDB705